MSDLYNPVPGGAPGPAYAQLLAILQELVTATNAQAQIINGSMGQPTSGDLEGLFPGPVNVVSTHLTAPLPVGQGGTGLAAGNEGGLLYFSAPNAIGSTIQLAPNALLLGGGTMPPLALGSLGLATTVLHGNPAGAPSFGAVVTADIADRAVTYAKIQNQTASTLLGNPTGGLAAPSEVTLGATLAFVAAALQTVAITGDVTAAADSFATTVGKIAGVDVAVANWTPDLQFGGAATGITYSVQSGTAIRLAKLVVAFFGITLTSKGSATGNATIEGLPVACGTLAGVGVIGAHANMATGNVFEIDVPASGTAIGLGKGNAAASAALQETDFNNTTSIAGVAVYLTA